MSETILTPEQVVILLNKAQAEVQRQNDIISKIQSDAEFIMNKAKTMMYSNPRAWKLMTQGKRFLVVACHESYAFQVYQLIRTGEKENGTWTDEDESIFQEFATAWYETHPTSEPGPDHLDGDFYG